MVSTCPWVGSRESRVVCVCVYVLLCWCATQLLCFGCRVKSTPLTPIHTYQYLSPLGPQNGLSHLEEGPDGKEHRERVWEKRARKGGYSWGNWEMERPWRGRDGGWGHAQVEWKRRGRGEEGDVRVVGAGWAGWKISCTWFETTSFHVRPLRSLSATLNTADQSSCLQKPNKWYWLFILHCSWVKDTHPSGLILKPKHLEMVRLGGPACCKSMHMWAFSSRDAALFMGRELTSSSNRRTVHNVEVHVCMEDTHAWTAAMHGEAEGFYFYSTFTFVCILLSHTHTRSVWQWGSLIEITAYIPPTCAVVSHIQHV